MAYEHLGSLKRAVDEAAQTAAAWVPRIWQRDHTVWQEDPTEVADRLGWLDCPTGFQSETARLRAFADGLAEDGITDVLLVGMGGSSLYPEVLATTFGAQEGAPRLTVLDSTAPAAVTRVRDALDWTSTLVVAASKSGGTTETRSHLAYFTEVLRDAVGERAGSRLVAITDPGSALEELGREQGFREVFTNPTDIGGRFSALSLFGLVPAALLGLDVDAHLRSSERMAETARRVSAQDNLPLRLGAAMAVAAREGRDKLTVLLPERMATFGLWIEQLVAESTGKHGVGILPVVDEPVLPPDAYGDDRLFVAVGDHDGLDALIDAGHPVVQLERAPDGRTIPAEVFRWEFATAVAGALLGINPFDQPDVQAAKTATARALDEGFEEAAATPAEDLLSTVETGDYVGLLAFVDPDGDVAARLDDVAAALRSRLEVPVTVGLGPRYLHSTGQLHKGGPDSGVFLVVVGEHPDGVDVPGRPYDFGTLVRAQAAGDLEALGDAGRRAGRVTADDLLRLA
jgi:transaldolase/glucose-6-phosphate isomerase